MPTPPRPRVLRGGSRVVQGSFPGGRPRMPAAPHVAAAALQGGMVQRSPAPVQMAQPRAFGGAVELPPGLLDTSRSGPGQPLPAPLRERMESALGSDFSSVRVHQGPQAASIGALAFTSGSDLYFAPGQYDPGSLHGQKLIAHELTHVVQQRAGRVRNPFGHGVAAVQYPALEAEAERMARGVAQLRLAPAAVARTARPAAARGVIQRLSYRSSKTKTVFRINFSTAKNLKFTAEDNSGNSAYLDFEYWDRLGPTTALVLSFYGKDMKMSGTRVGYLLFYLFGLKAQKDGKTKAQLATAVFKDEAGHIYSEIGFDTTSAETLSKSVVPISQVISNAQAKLSGYWDPAEEEVSVVSVNTPLLDTQQSSCCCWPFNKCCFLTSACTAARGLPDDCEELTVLRGFRDGYLSETGERRDLVARYYEIAPPIVTAIEGSGRAGEEYEAIYGTVAACVELIRNGQNEEAMRRYRSMVEDLESRHLMQPIFSPSHRRQFELGRKRHIERLLAGDLVHR